MIRVDLTAITFEYTHTNEQDIRLISTAAASNSYYSTSRKTNLIAGHTVPAGRRPHPRHMLPAVAAASVVSSHLQY